MSTDVLANFSCLDELVQIIYQNEHRFVVLSAVAEEWVVHLGLAGSEGRWWRGSWSKHDILQIVGSRSSDKILETFAENIAEAIHRGELYIVDWSTEEGAKIKLNFGPSSKKPLHMPMVEIRSAEAAAFATNLFVDIALQAQSRRCRLHPDQYTTPAPVIAVPPPRSKPDSGRRRSIEKPGPTRTAKTQEEEGDSSSGSAGPSSTATAAAAAAVKAEEEIKALKAELKRQKNSRMVSPPQTGNTKPQAAAMKGASLANPNKRARKYQAIEFASDEE